MPFPSAPILDNFNRANEGPPMTGWTAFGSIGLKVLTNQCAPFDTADNSGYWTTAMTSSDVECYVTIATHPIAGGETAVFARHNPAGGGAYGSYYQVSHLPVAGTDTVVIYRVDASVATTLATFNQELAAGNKLGIRCIGSTIEAWVFTSGAWKMLGWVADSTYTGAAPNDKLALYNGGNGGSGARYDDFGGGSVGPDVAPINRPKLIYLRNNR